MTDYITYAKSLCASGKGLIHDYRAGHLVDLSGNAAASTPGGAVWEADSKGYQLQCKSGGISVADQASLRCSSALSIVCFGDFARANITEALTFLLAKKDAAATDYALGFTDETALFFTIGATSSAIAFDGRGARSIAVTVATGEAPKSYLDGAYEADGASALTPTDAGKALYIGEDYDDSGRLLNSPLDAVLIFPDVELTAAQITELYRLYRLRADVGRGAPQRPRWFVPEDLGRTGLVGHWANFDDGVDETANGNDGTRSGVVTGAEGVYGCAFDFHGSGSGALTVTAAASINDLSAKTVCAWINPRSAGQSDTGTILSKGWKVHLASDATFATLRLTQPFSGDDGVWSYALPAADRDYHVGVTYDSSSVANNPVFVINGLEVTPTEVTAPTGTVDTDAASNLIIGNDGSSALAFAGWIDDARLYNTALTVAQIREIYLEGASKARVILPRFSEPITLVNSTGAPIGPFRFNAGEWKLDDNGSERYLQCVSAGDMSAPSSQAYGSWKFKINKAAATAASYVIFAANMQGGIGTTGLNGYALEITTGLALKIVKVTNGVVVSTIAQSSASYISTGTDYEIEITRDTLDGAFNAYKDESSWGAGSVDETYTTCSFFTVDLQDSDKVSLIQARELGMTRNPSDGASDLSFPTITNDQSTLLTTSLSLACPAGSGNAVTVLWGDGTSEALTCDGVVNTLSKTYSVAGNYQVKVVGDVARITTFICWYQSWLSGAYSNVIAGLVDVEKLHIWGCSFTGAAGDFDHLLLVTDLLYTRGANLLVDGDMEAVGVAAWSASNANLSKQGSAYQGARCLRVAATDANASGYQVVLTVGKTYRITGVAQGDGAGSTPRILVGAVLWVGDTATTWGVYDVTFMAASTILRLGDNSPTGGTPYVEFDASYITEVI